MGPDILSVSQMKGKFITLEGTEGSGKSLQAGLLSQRLKDAGYSVVPTREPGSTAIGERIRRILLDPGNKNLCNETELFLYLADRAQHVREVIQPALRRGAIVICDRFADATVAYQGYGRKFPLKLVRALNRLAADKVMPDLTIVLDVPIKTGLIRAKRTGPKGGDRMERQKLRFYRDLRSGYLRMANEEPRRIKVVKVRSGVQSVHKKILGLVGEIVDF